jgi:2'-5' RNA ligase
MDRSYAGRVEMGRRSFAHLDSRRQLVVVALPDEDDPVRKYSSEKEPHLTLLYLGNPDYDDEQIAHIEGYVEHAASLIHSFVLEVESRGELGDNQADVLFLSKRWSREIVTFREQLLQDPLISAAYHSADQFPEWTPHLTMGFPENPAKKDGNETPRFYAVNFNRIALWTGDSIGPTVRLKPYDYDSEVAMSQLEQGRSVVESHLEHFGVKGMKWGVRRADKSDSTESASEDARAAKEATTKLKSSGVKSLSNKELKDLVERMSLEQRYSTLVADKSKNSPVNRGHDKVKKTLKIAKTVGEIHSFANSPTGKLIRETIEAGISDAARRRG